MKQRGLFLAGIFSMALVFGMMVVSCPNDNETNSDDNSTTTSTKYGGTINVVNASSKTYYVKLYKSNGAEEYYFDIMFPGNSLSRKVYTDGKYYITADNGSSLDPNKRTSPMHEVKGGGSTEIVIK